MQPAETGGPVLHSHSYGREWLLLWLLFALLAALGGYRLLQGREQLLQHELGRMQVQTRTIEDNLVHQLEGVNNALAGVRYDLMASDRDARLQLFPLRLKVLTDAMPGVRATQVLDANGLSIASSRRELIGQQFGDRPYFKLARERRDDTQLYVSPPFKSMLGSYVVLLSRSMTAPDGSFAGLVTASLEPEYFELLLRSVLAEPDMVAAMIHGDGRIVVSWPHRDVSIGIDLNKPGSMFARHMAGTSVSSAHDSSLVSTGERRLLALRTIQPPALGMDRPLVVSVSRRRSDVLSPWRTEALMLGLAWLLSAGAASLALGLSQRRRQAAARSAQAQARAERESARRFEFGLKGADLGLWDWDMVKDELQVNDREWEMLGQPREQEPLKSSYWLSLMHPEDAPAVQAAFDAHMRGDTPAYRIEHRMRHRDGRWIWVLDHAMVMERDAAGKPTRMVGTHLDITGRVQSQLDLQRMNEQLEALSLTDGLTGAGNRRQFDLQLAAEWARGTRQGQALALLMIDVDHFKRYNDRHGHPGGDACLRQVADLLQGCLRRPLEQLARYGGEEFAVLLMAADAQAASVVAQRCLDAIAGAQIPHGASPMSPWVSVSIGVASLLPGAKCRPEQLIKAADMALYQAKAQGRGQFVCAPAPTLP